MRNRAFIKAEAAARFPTEDEPSTPNSPEEIEAYATWIVETLQGIAKLTVPGRIHSDHTKPPWWNARVSDSTRQARRAFRDYMARRTPTTWDAKIEADMALQRAVREERRRTWRALLNEASGEEEVLWKLDRWARLRSGLPYSVNQLPELKRTDNDPLPAISHPDKTTILANRFFPPEAVIPPLPQLELEVESEFPQFTKESVQEAIGKMKPWKAPGEDGIPVGLIKDCGGPAFQAIGRLANATLTTGHFPA